MTGEPEQRVKAAQLQQVEAQLYALLRQQSKRNQPMELPRPEFWQHVSLLLQNIEVELVEISRNEGWGPRAQNLARRQANLRRAVADLTRHRLTAFVQHAAAANLASAPFGDLVSDSSARLKPIDWTRHDPAERAFHAGLTNMIEQYKQQISWTVLQRGIDSSSASLPSIEAGQQQLDELIQSDGGLTGAGAPQVEVQQRQEKMLQDTEMDEEERFLHMEGFSEFRDKDEPQPEPLFDPLDGQEYFQKEEGDEAAAITVEEGLRPQAEVKAQENPTDVKNSQNRSTPETEQSRLAAAEGEVRPTAAGAAKAASGNDSEKSNSGEKAESGQDKEGQLMRIRILQDLPEPLVDEDGELLELLAGDVQFCSTEMAELLIGAELAEEASL